MGIAEPVFIVIVIISVVLGPKSVHAPVKSRFAETVDGASLARRAPAV